MIVCPECGSTRLKNKGLNIHASGTKLQRYQCKDCKHPFQNPVEERSGGTEFKEDGNHAVAVLKDIAPRSLDDLIEWCKIDLSVWEVDHWVGNSWTVINKYGKKFINHQVKAWLIRKEPVKHDWPVVSPVKASKPVSIARRGTKRNFKRALIVPDSQTGFLKNQHTGRLDPFHDRLAWDIVCQIAEDRKPDVIIMLGDMFDFPMYSDKYKKSPDFYFSTQPALEENFQWFQRLAKTGAKMHYLEGNHEIRLRDMTIANTIESYGLKPANQPDASPAISVENLAGLDSLGIEYHSPYPHSAIWLNDNIRVSHGETVRSGSGKSVDAVLKEARNSEIFGHTHRLESAHKTVFPKNGAVVYGAYSVGTIARLDSGVVPSNSSRNNWQQGFAEVNYEDGNGEFEVRLTPIFDGNAILYGEKYESRSHGEIEDWLNRQCENWNFSTGR